MSVIKSILICMTFQNSSKVMSMSLKCTFLSLFLVLGSSDQTSYEQFPCSLVAGFCVSVAGPDGLNFKVACS